MDNSQNFSSATTVESNGNPAAQQNFPLAIIVGIGAAIAGAVLWAIVAVITQMEIGLIAVAIGYVVGQAIRAAGKGLDQKFGILGAICALFGCVLGNLLSAIAFYSKGNNVPFLNVLSSFDFGLYQRLMVATFQAMDLLFYAIAIYEGYRFAIRYRVKRV